MAHRVGLLITLVALALSGPAWAEPVVQPGAKPGAAIAWKTEGGTVVLTIDEGYDPAEVAKAIAKGVPGAKARAKGERVMVTGLAEAKLLEALTRVSVEPLLDDIDSMLQTLQAGAGEQQGTGSSIRATKAMAMEKLFGPQEERVTAEVLAVSRGRFPLVLVTVRLDRVPKDSPLKAGDKITVVPDVPNREGRISSIDAQSRVNVGAWYAQPGDRIELRLGRKRNKVWLVEAYRRIRP